MKKFPFLKGKDVEVKATASGSSFAAITGSVETKGIKVNSLEERVNILEENYKNLNEKIDKIKNSINERIDTIQTQSKNDKEELNEKIVDIEKEQIKINQKNKSNHVFEFIGSLSIITGLILDLISKNMLINYLF